MKRLKSFLLSMDNNTTTYKAMYEGEIIVPAGSYGNPSPEPIVESDPIYWYGDISVRIETTHKNAKDKHLGRYVAVNLENYNTIEFRIFRGTLNYKTFIATLQLIDEI